MMETGREIGHGTCCLCLSDDESTFHTNSIMKSLPLHEMVNYCIGIQINPDNLQEPTFSTAICNECVLNINNFYSFKKRVLDAQELINSLNSKTELINATEYVEDDVLQIDDLNEDSEHLMEMMNDNENDGVKTDLLEIVEPTKPTILQVVYVDKTENNKKRPNELPSSSPKTSNKKSKSEITTIKKVTIQMNECLICPAILSDIFELKDHIDAHTNIRCKACGRLFARYSNLKRHFNSNHSKPKPFQCDLCGLAFNFSVNLQSHAALHYSGKLRKE